MNDWNRETGLFSVDALTWLELLTAGWRRAHCEAEAPEFISTFRGFPSVRRPPPNAVSKTGSPSVPLAILFIGGVEFDEWHLLVKAHLPNRQ
jgi:hypothetical protein